MGNKHFRREANRAEETSQSGQSGSRQRHSREQITLDSVGSGNDLNSAESHLPRRTGEHRQRIETARLRNEVGSLNERLTTFVTENSKLSAQIEEKQQNRLRRSEHASVSGLMKRLKRSLLPVAILMALVILLHGYNRGVHTFHHDTRRGDAADVFNMKNVSAVAAAAGRVAAHLDADTAAKVTGYGKYRTIFISKAYFTDVMQREYYNSRNVENQHEQYCESGDESINVNSTNTSRMSRASHNDFDANEDETDAVVHDASHDGNESTAESCADESIDALWESLQPSPMRQGLFLLADVSMKVYAAAKGSSVCRLLIHFVNMRFTFTFVRRNWKPSNTLPAEEDLTATVLEILLLLGSGLFWTHVSDETHCLAGIPLVTAVLLVPRLFRSWSKAETAIADDENSLVERTVLACSTLTVILLFVLTLLRGTSHGFLVLMLPFLCDNGVGAILYRRPGQQRRRLSSHHVFSLLMQFREQQQPEQLADLERRNIAMALLFLFLWLTNAWVLPMLGLQSSMCVNTGYPFISDVSLWWQWVFMLSSALCVGGLTARFIHQDLRDAAQPVLGSLFRSEITFCVYTVLIVGLVLLQDTVRGSAHIINPASFQCFGVICMVCMCCGASYAIVGLEGSGSGLNRRTARAANTASLKIASFAFWCSVLLLIVGGARSNHWLRNLNAPAVVLYMICKGCQVMSNQVFALLVLVLVSVASMICLLRWIFAA